MLSYVAEPSEGTAFQGFWETAELMAGLPLLLAASQEVSYCQGMSQIAALLLMFLNEEDAFWALSQLLTNHKHAMHGEMKMFF